MHGHVGAATARSLLVVASGCAQRAPPPPSAYVFDFGMNQAGFARLNVKGPRGAVVTLKYAEVLKPDGSYDIYILFVEFVNWRVRFNLIVRLQHTSRARKSLFVLKSVCVCVVCVCVCVCVCVFRPGTVKMDWCNGEGSACVCTGINCANQTDAYTLRGDADGETFTPRFT